MVYLLLPNLTVEPNLSLDDLPCVIVENRCSLATCIRGVLCDHIVFASSLDSDGSRSCAGLHLLHLQIQSCAYVQSQPWNDTPYASLLFLFFCSMLHSFDFSFLFVIQTPPTT